MNKYVEGVVRYTFAKITPFDENPYENAIYVTYRAIIGDI